MEARDMDRVALEEVMEVTVRVIILILAQGVDNMVDRDSVQEHMEAGATDQKV